jgi:hypothetical protein
MGGSVEPDFTSEEWAKLTTLERLAKCEKFAVEAERLGQREIAKLWRDLAAEIKAQG